MKAQRLASSATFDLGPNSEALALELLELGRLLAQKHGTPDRAHATTIAVQSLAVAALNQDWDVKDVMTGIAHALGVLLAKGFKGDDDRAAIAWEELLSVTGSAFAEASAAMRERRLSGHA